MIALVCSVSSASVLSAYGGQSLHEVFKQFKLKIIRQISRCLFFHLPHSCSSVLVIRLIVMTGDMSVILSNKTDQDQHLKKALKGAWDHRSNFSEHKHYALFCLMHNLSTWKYC